MHRPCSLATLSAASANPAVARTRGTVLFAFKPSLSDFIRWVTAGISMRLYRINNGGAEFFEVAYDGGAASFEVAADGGISASAAQSIASLSDEGYHWIAVRYSGPTGDEDLGASELQIIADGTAGAAVAYNGLDDVADQLVYTSEAGDGYGFGHFRAWQSFPRVLSVAECAAWGRRECV
jgi:hypothetical protein